MLRKLLEFLLLSNIFISLCAVSLVFQTYILFNNKISLTGIVFVSFFSTLFIYNNHRRIAFAQKVSEQTSGNYILYNRLTFIAFTGVLISLFFCSLKEILILVPLGFISIFYSVPLIYKNNLLIRLREVPFMKIFLIAFVWSVTTVILPAINRDENIFSPEVLMLLLRRMLFIFAITMPFDIRDVMIDASGKIKTLPLVLGVKRARKIALIALFLFLVLGVYEYLARTFQPYLGLAFLVSAAITALLIIKSNPKNKFYHYYLGLDGMMLLQFMLVLIAGNI